MLSTNAVSFETWVRIGSSLWLSRVPERIQRKTPSPTHIIDFEPELQIFVGIGGSRKEDVPIGSVVAAEHVYMPYSGKYGETGFSARPREFAADPQLLEVARKVRRDKNGSSGFATPRTVSCRPSTNEL